MQWNFEETKPDRLLMGTTFDVGLFFLAVVLLVMVAVVPQSDLASGVAPGEPIVWYSFYLSAPVSLLWIGVFIHRRNSLKRGRGAGALSEELSAIYSLINGLIVISVGGWLIYAALNAKLDEGQQQEHYAQVLHKEIEDSGRFENFQLWLSDWRHEGETLKLDVSSDFFEQVVEAETCLRLVVQPGAFGHEWIVEHEPYQWSKLTADTAPSYQCRAAWEQKSKLADSTISRAGDF